MPTYEQFRAMLPIYKHRLDDDLEIQAQFLEDIAAGVTIRNSRMIEAKEELAKIEGRLSDEVRDDDPKMTVGAIAAKVGRDPSRVRAWQKYQEARSDHERWGGLLDAWKNRGYSIKTLADLYAAQYFSLSSHQAKDRSIGRRDEPNDARRAEMRVAGRRPSSEPGPEPEPTKPTRRRMMDE